MKCHGCITSNQVSYQNKTLKYISDIKVLLTRHCLNAKKVYLKYT